MGISTIGLSIPGIYTKKQLHEQLASLPVGSRQLERDGTENTPRAWGIDVFRLLYMTS